MKIIKLNAIQSTNSYLKELLRKTKVDDKTIVRTDKQTIGRGQMGAGWYSKAGESLTFSVLKRYESSRVLPPMFINLLVSLAIFKAMKLMGVKQLKIKWPNDILSCGKKICGVLIENQFKGTLLKTSVVGIGINVNLQSMEDYPKASSMLITSGREFNLEEVFETVAYEVISKLDKIELLTLEKIRQEYYTHMFRFNEISVFKIPNGEQFNGIIKGVDPHGMLLVQLEDESVQSFGLKEITMLY